jgi:hypothetical protein
VVLLVAVIVLAGCAGLYQTAPPRPKTKAVRVEDENVAVSVDFGQFAWCSSNPNAGFDTEYTHDFTGLWITARNKTQKTIEVDWNKTAYLRNGNTDGGFIYSGIKFSQRESANRRPDYILPGKNMVKRVWPNCEVELVTGTWMHRCLPNGGTVGVLLVYRLDGVEHVLPCEIGR